MPKVVLDGPIQFRMWRKGRGKPRSATAYISIDELQLAVDDPDRAYERLAGLVRAKAEAAQACADFGVNCDPA